MMNTGPASRYRDSPHTARGIPLSSNPTMTLAAPERAALVANPTFEQPYEHINGDTAASAELYALLADLAAVPPRQDIAATGSVNEHGSAPTNAQNLGLLPRLQAETADGAHGVIIPESCAPPDALSRGRGRRTRGTVRRVQRTNR